MRSVNLLDLFCGSGEASTGYMQAAAALNIRLNITGLDSKNVTGYPYKFVQDSPLHFLHSHSAKFHFIHYHRGVDLSHEIRDYLYANATIAVIAGHNRRLIRPDVYLSPDMFGVRDGQPCLFECVNWMCFRPGNVQILELKDAFPLIPYYSHYIGLQLLNLKFPLL